MKIEENAKSFFGFFVSKLKVSLVSSVIGVIKDFEFGEVIFSTIYNKNIISVH